MLDLSTLSMTEIIRLQTRLQEELARRFECPMAVVFSDIVGSTPYFARYGDGAGRQLQQLHFDLLAAALPGTDGRIVDTVGDGAFLAFPTASKAVAGIIAFLRAAAGANESRGHQHQLQVRIGMHWGSVLTDGTAVSGDAVNLCARVTTCTEPGEVRLTRGLFLELERTFRLNCHPLGFITLKGFDQPVELLVLDWRDPTRFPRSLLVEETDERIALPQQDIVTFGRLVNHAGARANDIVLSHPDPSVLRQVSRWHFELRRSEHGLCLLALSDGITTVDDIQVARGHAVDVRADARIGVAGVLTLRLIGADRNTVNIDDASTMLLIKGRRADLAEPEPEVAAPSRT
jgi:class 3 adenylate cyclase